MAGTPQPAAQKGTHLIVVFGEKDPRHCSKGFESIRKAVLRGKH